MGSALAWGAVAASSLLLGALIGFALDWPPRLIGLVLAFGAGALISAVSFELAEEGLAVGSPGALGLGLAVGALTYFTADGLLTGRDGGAGRRREDAAGSELAVGAFLDGIPEQLVLGIGIAAGDSVSVALVVAIFVSNLPEAVGSATGMATEPGRSRGAVLRLFAMVAAVCTAATVVGYALADSISGEFLAVANGFAAGALLVMLVDSMVPEARAKAGRTAGLATVVGFAVAITLSNL
jgi:ZIP family zinc transporter